MNQKPILLAFLLSLILSLNLSAQTPIALVSGIQIDSVLVTKSNVTRLSRDPISGNLYYSTGNGDIYEVRTPVGQAAYDTLVFTFGDHAVEQPQGMCFLDSALFISGNTGVAQPGKTSGVLMRGDLQANGTRDWTFVAGTDLHPKGTHPFTSVITDPAGEHLYWASGARTLFGEVADENGLFPGYREGPINSKIYRFPIDTTGVVLPNDSALLDSSGFVYVKGVRNAYSMAFDGQDQLFSIDNSGERDDPEELNWIQEGHNYGFPWRMGGNWNPLMHPSYDVNNDPMVNQASGGYQLGLFAADPNFPAPPPSLVFDEPAYNYGPDADKYRDSLTGQVRDASDDGILLQSFTSHRSPLGLIIDRDSLLGGGFRGKAYVLSYMPGGDSTGMSPISPWGGPGPFVDPCQDMLRMQLGYDSGYDNYTFTCDRIIEGFYLPVDAVQFENYVYVLEQRGGGRSNLWKVTFPTHSVGTNPSSASPAQFLQLHPNPTQRQTTLSMQLNAATPLNISIFDVQGRLVRDFGNQKVGKGRYEFPLDLEGLASGIFLVRVQMGNASEALRLVVE